jgi:broad specificity phosphatase PhoE
MLIALVRHGETIENSQRTIQGHLPGQLTSTGRQQAKRLGEKLHAIATFDQIISSDLERAKETAAIISSELELEHILFDEKLRERNYGVLEGKPIMTLKRMLVEGNTDIRQVLIPGGEGYDEMVQRLLEFYHALIATHHDRKIVVVTHAGVIRALIENIAGTTASEISNCGGYLLTLANNKEVEITIL